MKDIDPCFCFWCGGRFDEKLAGRKAIPVKDSVGVWRDYFTGAPCDPPKEPTHD